MSIFRLKSIDCFFLNRELAIEFKELKNLFLVAVLFPMILALLLLPERRELERLMLLVEKCPFELASLVIEVLWELRALEVREPVF
jgi:hypothetical protein